jgi:two-component system, OmpR family, alkaline phosphatase synthesis response regulator PhoP
MEGITKKILIVDDDPDIRLFLEFNLKKKGFGISQAANGEKALEILKDQIPDLIITDMMMPILDGYGLLEAVKKNTELSHIPVIMLTGEDNEEAAKRAIQPDESTKKPFSTADILEKIEKLLLKT